MKKLILMLTVLATLSMTASAQKKQDRVNKDSKFAKELNLSTDQQEKMKSLNEEFSKKMSALKSDESLSKETKREKMKELFTDKRQKSHALLTPEQKQKMESMRANRKDVSKHDRNKKGRHSGKAKADLNLSEAQKSQMKNLREQFRADMKALKDDSSLSKDSKIQKRKELSSSHKEKVMSILTTEQQSKMKENFSKDKKDSRKNGKHHDKRSRSNRGTDNNTKAMSIS